MHPNEISGSVLDAAIRVHDAVGPGLLESAYEAFLAQELRNRGHTVEVQRPMPASYGGVSVGVAYRMDLLVDDVVVVELKTVAKLLSVHEAQLLTYLRLSGRRLGLLINFHELRLKNGVKRIVNGLREPP